MNSLANAWFEQKLQQTITDLAQSFETYRLSEAIMTLRALIWDDFCSWYLEMIKPAYGEPIDRPTLEQAIQFFERLMTLLHPFMPFVTEEIWHQLKTRSEGEDCIISQYPNAQTYDQHLINDFATAQDIVAKIRDARNSNGLKQKELLQLFIQESESTKTTFQREGLGNIIQKMAYLSELNFTQSEVDNSVAFLSGTGQYFLAINKTIDVTAERERLVKELEYAQGFVRSVEKKLSNERFVNNAPAAVVDKERKKLSDGQERIKRLEENLGNLN